MFNTNAKETPIGDVWLWWKRRHKADASDADAIVAAWKAAWRDGAKAAWSSARLSSNPHTTEPNRTAWAAGWRWAERNPDRRQPRVERLAHPHRRETDSQVSMILRRAAKIGATGVVVYAATTAVRRWMRHRQTEIDAPKHS
jgi:hypothetical protein